MTPVRTDTTPATTVAPPTPARSFIRQAITAPTILTAIDTARATDIGLIRATVDDTLGTAATADIIRDGIGLIATICGVTMNGATAGTGEAASRRIATIGTMFGVDTTATGGMEEPG